MEQSEYAGIVENYLDTVYRADLDFDGHTAGRTKKGSTAGEHYDEDDSRYFTGRFQKDDPGR